ncbi:GAF domain-containing protein [Bacillus timonensis]|uniref:GAF domain-containing protein n=1 Tax=Bacillus timonensis TaxID=1033734 RepID=UPI00028929FB|nr:GAF domain-containing protein [Bacillus timonensis]
MEAIQVEIEQKLHDLCTNTSSDFSAFANVDQGSQTIRWEYAHGFTNNRYKNMVIRPGKGLSGSVVRFGTTMVLDIDTPNRQRTRLQYPIMLAENLVSAVAVPVQMNGKVGGVLLIGSRTEVKYTTEQVELLKKTASEITEIKK